MKGQQNNQQQPNSGMDIIYIVGFFMALLVAAWYFYHPVLVRYLFTYRLFQADLIKDAIEAINGVLSLVFLPTISLQNLDFAIQNMQTSDVATISYEQVVIVSSQVNGYLSVPSVILAMILCGHLLFFKASSRFKEKYSMASLRSQEKVNWPEIIPIVNTNLIKTDIDKTPWNMSVQPIEFAKQHKLLDRVIVDNRPAAELNKGRAYEVFSSQMGRRWSNLQDFKIHELALFAVFSARIAGDDKSAKKLLDQMSLSGGSGKVNFNGTYPLLRKHVQHKAVGKAVSPHAYVLTAMSSLLQVARATGVLASAEFLWLKKVDRRLWYMLCSVGRQTPFPEVAGPFAHWIIEKKLRRPLKVPAINEAVIALDVAVKEVLYNPDED